MQEMESFFKVLLWACGALITLGGAGAIIIKWINPYRQLLHRVGELERISERFAKLFERDLARFDANDERDNMMMEALFTLIEHARTNNSTGLMEATSKKMQAYLIHRK